VTRRGGCATLVLLDDPSYGRAEIVADLRGAGIESHTAAIFVQPDDPPELKERAVLLGLALAEGGAGIAQELRAAAAITDYQSYTDRLANAIPPRSRVLALHQFWFGLYSRHYVYRSLALPAYLSDPDLYPVESLTMEQAIDRVSPEYILVDDNIAPDLRLDLPAESVADEPWRSFRRYLEHHCARPVARIDDRDYGELTILQVCP